MKKFSKFYNNVIKDFNYTLDYVSDKNIYKRYKQKCINDYYNNLNFCKYCGKIIPFENRFGKFCSNACSASYNNKNKGKRTIAEKKNISNGIKKYLQTNKNNIYLSDAIKYGIIVNKNNIIFNDRLININNYNKLFICPICGKKYKPHIIKNSRIKISTTCSKECAKALISQKNKEHAKVRIKNGIFKGWQSRNILSYPEKFWIEVLKNNNIAYISNKPFKYDEIHNYFLDFYIEYNGRKIDLEIDGKQHKYTDRKESDKIRDERVINANIEVYRVEWNEINSVDGKKLMKLKIDNFLNFLNLK